MSQTQDIEFPYLPPCMKCQPIIEYSNIQYHNQPIPSELELFVNPEYKFGIFDIAIRGEIPVNKKHIHIFFSIDSSGSMNDRCLDGRSKMQHILFTLENILRIFHQNPDCSISVHVQSFDVSINKIISDIDNIKEHDIETLISKINEIRPDNATNIELALRSAKEQIDIYKQKNIEHEVVHLFLTDGEITVGNDNDDLLKSIVPKDCTNIFIGYGLDHDSYLLSLLSSESGNEYRFIDALEKAGLVYGEIIHSILYKAITDVTIKALDCKIYDYKTNTWVSELNIENLLSEQKKTYHLRSRNPMKSVISVVGRTIIKTRQFQVMTNEIELQSRNSFYTTIFEGDLTKYVFRQRTQELLYESRCISNKKRVSGILNEPDEPEEHVNQDEHVKQEMKTKLKTFLNLMVDYMNKNNMEADSIMKMLCDDIYITYKTIGTSIANMFSCARQTSQGRQQSYTAGTIDSQDQQIVEAFDLDEFPPRPPPLGLRRRRIIRDNDDINYTFTQTFLSPYSSPGIVTTMREVTGDYTLEMTQPL